MLVLSIVYLVFLPTSALGAIVGDHVNLGLLNNKTGIDRDLQQVVGEHEPVCLIRIKISVHQLMPHCIQLHML